jgi:hypothetical protein
MTTPRPPAVRPPDDVLAALGIVWVDERGVTPAGLPYPASSDPAANGAANIQALAQALDVYPRGLLAHFNWASGPDWTGGNQMTTTVTIPGNVSRRVRVHVQVQGTQITASATVNLTIYGGGVAGPRLWPGAVTNGAGYEWQGFGDFLAPPGAFTAYLSTVVTAGALRPTGGVVTFLTIEDLGKQF